MTERTEAEGGCGVIGLACAEQVAGCHLLPALIQMRNRGNGKGGGIAAAGLAPQQFGVTQEILDSHHLLAIAYLDRNCRAELEQQYLQQLQINHVHTMAEANPYVVVYFVKDASDETIYQNSYAINKAFYAATGNKRAFVLSHGKNLLVLKLVGYADDVIRAYQLEELQAHVWIGHHRYPTKGRVWHPGGAHPFIGLNEALVHNGDFANYYSLSEYLAQRRIFPLFLTDTEVAALLFDLYHRTYKYPLEYVIEALAPTTDRDFSLLPPDKQRIYQHLQQAHMRGSPDGPWFFLIAQSLEKTYRLIGITDTSMLRPQVFAMQNEHIGLAASEQQAIDATLESLATSNPHFGKQADHYWSARGGSHTDGGAFSFSVHNNTLACTNKFDKPVKPRSQPYQSQYVAPTSGVIIDATQFASEGDNSLSHKIVELTRAGQNKFTLINCRGHRFIACGLGTGSQEVDINVYGSSGDYLASGIDGATVRVFGSAQDQVGQIMKSGTLVIHGDVGQTFMYGAKGGNAFVRGNTAGRPLINAVGKPKVVINGSCLDYLAESFMAGDPLNGGGFVIVNGIAFKDNKIIELDTPYPGSNLFSLASGGAIYLRDPQYKISKSQLHGGEFTPMTPQDWELIEPYLKMNDQHFGIPIDRLLTWEGRVLPFHEVYRKIRPARIRALYEEEAWVKGV